MDPERWRRLEEVFQAALDCEPRQRAALVDEAAGGDRLLRQEVLSLLAAHDRETFTSAPAFEDAMRVLEATSPSAGWRIGPYEVVQEIGRGGMGRVYLAARADETFDKLVAIKVIPRGLDSDEAIHRFRSERQILATLEHPNITRLLDGGTTDDGLPYIVMELVDGQPIDEYCQARDLSILERLQLFQQVCAAVRYAHQNLVIHRDIKPRNVLVTEDGVPRLLDFGIAKLLDPTTAPSPGTVAALRPLTPDFASPEQVRGEPMTTASDVYSLGVLLYVLLTGRRPYRGPMSSPAEIEQAICEEEPEKPSVSVPDDSPHVKFRRRLEGDLDTIVLMALRKEPQRRYASVDQLSNDIGRHLANLPVVARRDTRRYRTAKFVRRNKIAVAAAGVVFVAVAGGVAATIWQSRVVARERDIARLEQAKAKRINAFLQEMIGYSGQTVPGSPTRAKGHDATVADMLDDAAQRVETELADQPEVKAEMLDTIGSTYSVLAKYDASARFLREAYALDLKLYGPDGRATASVMYQLANLSYLTGDYTSAESWIRKALPIYRKEGTRPDFELWRLSGMLSDAAFIMRARGHLDEAEALWLESLSYGSRLDPKHRAVLVSDKTFLAQLYMDRGDVERAESLAVDAVQDLRAQGAPFGLAQALIDLGNIRRAQHRYAEAESLIEEGTARYARAQGEEHPNVAYGLMSLATVHSAEEQYDRAEREARRALAITEQASTSAVRQAAIVGVLGRILTRTGRAAEAEPLLRQTLATVEQKLPPHSNATASALGALGECLAAEHRYGEAEPLLKESYAILRQLHVPQSPALEEARQRLLQVSAHAHQQ
ncbi:MAG TPA: serine/threonine-protein kinase [Vicinamibacterales bacterium]|jgi:serine/threonine-protein kinase|nr:serine/threonine-protein kinase [Vicinamibacterales bacterium]